MNKSPHKISWMTLLAAVGILAYSSFSLVDALGQAHSTGLVEVVHEYRGALRPKVPWPQAWAYFSGLAMIAAGGGMWTLHELGRKRFVPLILVVFAVGLPLLIFSGSFASIKGTLVLLGIVASILATFAVKAKFGRTAALWFWALIVVAAIFLG